MQAKNLENIMNILVVALFAVIIVTLSSVLALLIADETKPKSKGESLAAATDESPTIDQVAEAEPTTEEVLDIVPEFPEYIRPAEVLRDDPEGWFRGDIWVVVGRNGCLYENGYINEYLGAAPKYVNVTDSDLDYRVQTLKHIQDELAARGIAFCVAISPSKAAAMADYIPDWYKAENPPLVDNYVRPYVRFLKKLEEAGVYFVDSASLYRSIGLTNTFPKTGIHWNRLAAYETCVAIIAEYERQTGTEVKHLATGGVRYGNNPVASEQDIFGIIYSGRRAEREFAIIDDKYYWHDTYTANTNKPAIKHMLIQGGSFTGDFHYYFGGFGITSDMSAYYYNNGGDVNINWEYEIGRTSFVLLEVNEQFVYNMGGNAPSWGYSDIEILDFGPNIVDSLWNYLRNNPAG
ncbi:MAG: hypothetical protein FWH48_04645 [Oscillospiraceae bacterium]|nr:hypothetical protein [Oscillospiraceae bacterium]